MPDASVAMVTGLELVKRMMNSTAFDFGSVACNTLFFKAEMYCNIILRWSVNIEELTSHLCNYRWNVTEKRVY